MFCTHDGWCVNASQRAKLHLTDDVMIMVAAKMLMVVLVIRARTAHAYLQALGGDCGGDTLAHNDPIGVLVT